MIGVLLSLPSILLVIFYAWAVINVRGLVQGLHITALAISFFIISSPLLAYMFVFGLFPGKSSTEKDDKHLGIFACWLGSLILHFATISYFPKLYSCSPITKVAFETLTTPLTRNATVTISGVALVYHWLVSCIESRFFKIWFHMIGIIVSGLMFYWIIPLIRDVLIVVFNSGNENF